MSGYISVIEDLRALQAELDTLSPEELAQYAKTPPKPELEYARKHPARRNLPHWLEPQEDYLKNHYQMALINGDLEPDLDSDGFALANLECKYETALSTVYLAQDAWNHRGNENPGTDIGLALKELVSIRIDDYLRDYLRHFRFRKPKGELVRAALTSYPQLQEQLLAGKVSHAVVAQFISGKADVNISDNVIVSTLHELQLTEK